jgi:prepilin-type N-terminal cleavage/methylation domain-containing protein
MKKEHGFTLIEIAIVLVIIGLLLGGVLKGQELITSARVRNIISQQDGVKAAFYGFVDRYRAYPGDYLATSAQANIPGCGACNGGNNNGKITANGVDGATIDEQIAVWEHLSRAGFINGSYAYASPETTASAPTNPYARYLQLIYDTQYAGATGSRHNLKTGNQIPSDILAEIDRKVDDGVASAGSFRYSPYGGATGAPLLTVANPEPGFCYTTVAGVDTWVATSPIAECGATNLF